MISDKQLNLFQLCMEIGFVPSSYLKNEKIGHIIRLPTIDFLPLTGSTEYDSVQFTVYPLKK